MTDAQIDDLIKKSEAGEKPDPEVMARVCGTVLPRLKPVRQMAPPWIWFCTLLCTVLLVAAAGAFAGGIAGLVKLDDLRRVAIFTMLGVTTFLAIAAAVREMRPGGKRLLHPRTIALASIVLLLAVFALLFQDYRAVRAALGMSCMRMGLICSVVTAAIVWLVLSRGFVLDRVAVGIAAGTLAGLSGLTVLEIHCPIFTAPHVLVWHAGVLVISASAGALIGWWRRN